jgi:hypothetical protein
VASKDLVVRLLGDASNLNKALAGVGNDVSRTGAKLTKTLTPAAAAIGVAFAKMGSDWNDARDKIITGTGASGKALDGLMNDTKKVAGQVPQDFGTVGAAIAELNTRLGLTGEELQDVAVDALNFSRVTGVDVEDAVRTVSRTMKDWGIETENASDVMDLLFKASQETGIGVDELGNKLVQFGAPLRQLGFSMEESTALLAEFEAQGVNTELVMGGLRQSLGRMAKAGEEPAEAFHRLTDEIKNTASEGEATRLAMELFGARAGPDMAAAIREGRFEIADMAAALSDSNGAVSDAAERTLRLSDRFKMLKNRVTGVLGPFGEIGGAVGGAVAAIGPLMFGFGQMLPHLGSLKTKLGGATGALKLMGGAAVVAGAALFVLNQRQQQAAERAATLTSMFNEVSRASDEVISSDFDPMMRAAIFHFGDVESAVADFAKTNLEAAERVLELGAAQVNGKDISEELKAAIDEEKRAREQANKTSLAGVDATDDLSDALDDLDGATQDVDRATKDVTAAHKEYARGMRDAAEAAGEAEEAAKDFRLELVRSLTDVFSYEAAILNLEKSYDDYRDSVAETTATLQDSEATDAEKKRATIDQRLEQIALANEIARVAAAYAEEQGAVEGSQQQIDLMTAKLRELKAQYPELAVEIDTHIAKLHQIPGDVNTTASVDTSQAHANINALMARIHSIPTNVGFRGVGSNTYSRKSGGPVPGAKSEAVPILAHGGEYVLDAGTVDAIKSGKQSAGAATGSPSDSSSSMVGVHIDHAEFNSGVDVDTLMRAVNLHLAGV